MDQSGIEHTREKLLLALADAAEHLLRRVYRGAEDDGDQVAEELCDELLFAKINHEAALRDHQLREGKTW